MGVRSGGLGSREKPATYSLGVSIGYSNRMDLRKPSAAELAAIQAVWAWYCHNRDSRDISFAEIVQRTQERCPSASVECIRAEFESQLRRAQHLL